MIVTLPPAPIAAKIAWKLKQPAQVNRGEFKRRRSVTILPDIAGWEAQVEYPIILGEAAFLAWRGALARCQGRANPFWLEAGERPQLKTLATVVVHGSGQQGSTLVTRGWSDGQYLLDGHIISVARRLLQVVSNTAVADPQGQRTIAVTPLLPEGLLAGTAVEVRRPAALMAMADDSTGWTVDRGQQYSVAFACEEAVEVGVPDALAAAALAASTRRPATFCWLDIADEPVRVTDAPYSIAFAGTGDPDLDGHTFSAVDPRVVSVTAVKAKDTGTDTVALTLSGLAGVDAETMELLEVKANWQGRTARLWKGMVDPGTGALIGGLWAFYTGYMSVPKVVGDQSSQTIQLELESYLAFFGQSSNRTYLDQTSYDPGDHSAELAIAIANGASKRK